MTIKNGTTFTIAALASLAVCCLPAHSQGGWPTKPVSVIVGYPAGSATTAQLRVVTGPLAKNSDNRS